MKSPIVFFLPIMLRNVVDSSVSISFKIVVIHFAISYNWAWYLYFYYYYFCVYTYVMYMFIRDKRKNGIYLFVYEYSTSILWIKSYFFCVLYNGYWCVAMQSLGKRPQILQSTATFNLYSRRKQWVATCARHISRAIFSPKGKAKKIYPA